MTGYNHYADCTCGWCSKIRTQKTQRVVVDKIKANIREQTKKFPSYLNPNAYCPVCGVKVFFYQSPYGGRVFFDSLGKPWEKHPCTDNVNRIVTRIPMKDFPTYDRVGKFEFDKFNPFIIKYIAIPKDEGLFVRVSGQFGKNGIHLELKNIYKHDLELLEIDINSPCMMLALKHSYKLSLVNNRGEVIEALGVPITRGS